jgi:prolyl-tRNA editing enzyme YbaK/EbsC (Cys-tRNA(Pro) deacylase)
MVNAMPEVLSSSAQQVQNALAEKGMNCKVVQLADTARSAQDAANAIGCKVEQIVKSLVFRTRNTNSPVLVLASGSNRVNEKTVEQHLGEPLDKPNADFVRAKTGYAIGGIPPIGHTEPLKTFIDEDLFQYEELWAAGGTPHAVFKVKADELEQMTEGTRISIK